MKGYYLYSLIGISLANLGQLIAPATAQAEKTWYNCLTREAFTSEKQAWCDRWRILQEFTYTIPESLEENPAYITVNLENGRYGNTNEKIFVKLVNQAGWIAFGDLNNNNREDAAVILGVSPDPQGEAITTYLSAVLDVNGDAKAVNPVRLGERILLNGAIAIENNRVVIPFLTQTAAFNQSYIINGSSLEPLAQMQNSETIEDTLWYLKSYRNEAGEIVSAQVYRDNNPSLKFSEGRLGGNATCNRFFGSYALEGNQLTIEGGGSTLMACPDEFMIQERMFLTQLEQVNRYAIADRELQLLNAEGEILLILEKAVLPPLTGTPWQLTGYNNGRDAVVSVLAGTNITAMFDDNGGLTGFAGCNNYIFNYEATEETIEISSAGISTRKFCGEPEGVMEQEAAYLQSLSMAETYQIDGNTLTLRTASGSTVATFRVIQ